jgi:hypothetical protein
MEDVVMVGAESDGWTVFSTSGLRDDMVRVLYDRVGDSVD